MNVVFERLIEIQWPVTKPTDGLRLEHSSIIASEINDILEQAENFADNRTVLDATAVRFRFRFECKLDNFEALATELRRQLTELVPCLETGVLCTAGGSSIEVACAIEKLRTLL